MSSDPGSNRLGDEAEASRWEADFDDRVRRERAIRRQVLSQSQSPVAGEDAILEGFRAHLRAKPKRRRIPVGWLLGAAAAALLFGIALERSLRTRTEPLGGQIENDRYLGRSPYSLRDGDRFGVAEFAVKDFVEGDATFTLVVRALDGHDQPAGELWRQPDLAPGTIEVPPGVLSGVERIEYQLTVVRLGSATPQFVAHRQSR